MQRNYTMIQKELLSIVEVLTTFCPILLGSKFIFGPTMITDLYQAIHPTSSLLATLD
jgi:hypothetical protein